MTKIQKLQRIEKLYVKGQLKKAVASRRIVRLGFNAYQAWKMLTYGLRTGLFDLRIA